MSPITDNIEEKEIPPGYRLAVIDAKPTIDKLVAMKDGPIILRMSDAETYAICRCGMSGNKPFCDGQHAKEQPGGICCFEAPEHNIISNQG